MLTGLFVIKAAAILLILMLTGILFYKKSRSNDKMNSKFKHNVSLLREEKLLMHTDKKLQKRRQQLLKKTTKISKDVSQKQLISKSKKLGLPAGEILLAAKIQMCSK
jgi:uncharacterized protein with PIN domain